MKPCKRCGLPIPGYLGGPSPEHTSPMDCIQFLNQELHNTKLKLNRLKKASLPTEMDMYRLATGLEALVEQTKDGMMGLVERLALEALRNRIWQIYNHSYKGVDPDEKIPTEVKATNRPPVICLCGSTRFKDEFVKWNYRLTLKGYIVLSIGCDAKSDDELKITDEQKEQLDELHKRKIDMADSIFVINVGGYIGRSTASEIIYAIDHDKPVGWMEGDKVYTREECQEVVYSVEDIKGVDTDK